MNYKKTFDLVFAILFLMLPSIVYGQQDIKLVSEDSLDFDIMIEDTILCDTIFSELDSLQVGEQNNIIQKSKKSYFSVLINGGVDIRLKKFVVHEPYDFNFELLFGFSTNGYQFGIGPGLYLQNLSPPDGERLRNMYVPVIMTNRIFFGKRTFSPFIYFDGGAIVAVNEKSGDKKGKWRFINIAKSSYPVGCGLGFRIRKGMRSSLQLSIGYKTYLYKNYMFNFDGPNSLIHIGLGLSL